MARRNRVPRHKAHTRRRNKNPKLSPFQREQKRLRLANQEPTAKTLGHVNDIPHSQRRLAEYLLARRKRAQLRRHALTTASATDAALAVPHEQTQSSASTHSHDVATTAAAAAAAKSNSDVQSTSATVVAQQQAPALRALSTSTRLTACRATRMHRDEVAPAGNDNVAVVVEAADIIRRQDVLCAATAPKARQAQDDKRAVHRLHSSTHPTNMETRLQETRQRGSRTDEKKHLHGATRYAHTVPGHSLSSAPSDGVQHEHTHLVGKSCDTGCTVSSAAAAAPSPALSRVRDFAELTDVVRYGERVEAPPQFDTLPNAHAAVSRLAADLDLRKRYSRTMKNTTSTTKASSNGSSSLSSISSAKNRAHLLSGAGATAQQRRLVRLGLATDASCVSCSPGSGVASSGNGNTTPTTTWAATPRSEMEQLREHVAAAYARTRRNRVA